MRSGEWTLLWDGRDHPSDASGQTPPFAAPRPDESGGEGTNAGDQSREGTIPCETPEVEDPLFSRTGQRDTGKMVKVATVPLGKVSLDGSLRDIRGCVVNYAKGLRKAMSHVATRQQVLSTLAIGDMLEKAVLHHSEPHRAGSTDIRAAHTFYVPLELNDELYRAKLMVMEIRQGQRYYDHDLTEMERLAEMNGYLKFPDPVRAKILELIQRDDVRSVSCPFDDPDIWRALVAEQVRRVTGTRCEPQDAFTLCGPDGGLYGIPVEEWGGIVRIPYEGMYGGDLVIFPTWRNFFPENAEKTGRLSTAFRLCFHYLLTPRDFGELTGATRSRVGDWVLYKSTLRYAPCDPLGST